MAKKKSKQDVGLLNNGLVLAISGVVVFLLRYIPLFKYDLVFAEKWYSISSHSKVCGTILGGLADKCSWVEPLNTVMIVLAVLLVGYGGFLLYKQYAK